MWLSFHKWGSYTLTDLELDELVFRAITASAPTRDIAAALHSGTSFSTNQPAGKYIYHHISIYICIYICILYM